MKTTRLMILSAVALCFGLSSCVQYWEKRQQVKADEHGPREVIDDSHGRDYERYGIPPGPDNAPGLTRDRWSDGSSSMENLNVPVAQLTDMPDEVLSPFPPHRRINVADIRSGDLAKDPDTGEVFRVP